MLRHSTPKNIRNWGCPHFYLSSLLSNASIGGSSCKICCQSGIPCKDMGVHYTLSAVEIYIEELKLAFPETQNPNLSCQSICTYFPRPSNPTIQAQYNVDILTRSNTFRLLLIPYPTKQIWEIISQKNRIMYNIWNQTFVISNIKLMENKCVDILDNIGKHNTFPIPRGIQPRP